MKKVPGVVREINDEEKFIVSLLGGFAVMVVVIVALAAFVLVDFRY